MAAVSFYHYHWKVFDPGGSSYPNSALLRKHNPTEPSWPAAAAPLTVSSSCHANESKNELQLSEFAPDAFSLDVASFFDEALWLINAGHLDQALCALLPLYARGIVPDQQIYVSYLKACNKKKDLFAAKQLHAHLVLFGWDFVSRLGDDLLSTLCACGGFNLAAQLILMLPRKSVFTWKAIISAYMDNELEQEAFGLFEMMLEDGIQPDKYLYAIMIKGCGRLVDLDQGRAMHADAEERGLHRDTFVVSALIHMYGKCLSIAEAEIVFDDSKMLGDVVVWNAMLSVYVELGEPGKALQLYVLMQKDGPQPNSRTLTSAISACCILGEVEETLMLCLTIGEALHSDVRRMDLSSNSIINNNLLRMYGIYGCLTVAQSIFNSMMERNVVTWTIMLSAYLELGEDKITLQLYRQMQQERVQPDEKTLVVALQACCSLAKREEPSHIDGQIIKIRSLEIGKALHQDAMAKNFDADHFVNSTLISMYGLCGRIVEAENVFAGHLQHSVVLFNAMLSAYTEHGEGERALRLFRQMHEEGMQPDEQTIAIVMQACCIVVEKEAPFWRGEPLVSVTLNIGRALHGDALRRGFCSDVFVGCTLLRMYKLCGSIVDAENFISGLSTKHNLLWTELLSLYVAKGEGEKALQVFSLMQEKGVTPNKWAYVMAIQGCFVIVQRRGASGYAGEAALATALSIGRAIHADTSKDGLSSDAFIISSLLTLYSMCGDISGAEDVFSGLSQPDIVPWNAMLSAYLLQDDIWKVFRLYRNLESEGICQNVGTFVTALQACCTLAGSRGTTYALRGLSDTAALEIGRALHVDAQRKGFDTFPSFCSALILMYSNCASIFDVEGMFHGQLQHDIISWTALLAAYVEHGKPKKALQLFKLIHEEEIAPDERTLALALEACALLAEHEDLAGQCFKEIPLKIGHALHADCLGMGFASDASVGSNVVRTYGKCMDICGAENVFCKLPHHNILPWNAMLSTYIDHGQGEKALFLYQVLKDEDVPLNDFTILCLLQACSLLGNIETCREVHFLMTCEGWNDSGNLCTLLAYVYGSCALTVDCKATFDSIIQPDGAAWNAIISGHARNGDHGASIQAFNQMQFAKIELNRVTSFLLLSSCSHAGDVESGWEQLESISNSHGIIPSIDHLKWLIDSLGRAGDFSRVSDLVSDELIQPTSSTWVNALGAWQNYSNTELGNCFLYRA